MEKFWKEVTNESRSINTVPQGAICRRRPNGIELRYALPTTPEEINPKYLPDGPDDDGDIFLVLIEENTSKTQDDIDIAEYRVYDGHLLRVLDKQNHKNYL